MKIYSLQEENDKLNASRGITHPGINHSMFDVKKTTVSSRPQKRPAPQQRKLTPSVPQQRPVQPAAPRQGQLQLPPASSQQKPQPRQGRRVGMLIGWLLFMLFLFLVNYLSEMF